ncbi:hypothetical protein N0V93_008317 [Gnomoniopsis smithogilvyi]|uniref:Ricin B lectin domain-containing protein n=1 Tax=Gnomoniopsis smithogilvyi TaxID=1191159 RepID=A0A9W8YMQ1_9PEZI|nr:hypothetical protein N0V93_008317 [Gnomoniopsis smithogilvyi]
MEINSTDSFDSNQYYRLINLALGPEVSLDVASPQTTAPNGSLVVKTSGPFSGQIWQFLQSEEDRGHFYISSSFLGAKLKLDVLINDRGDYEPHLRNFTTEYNQTWTLTPHADVLSGNRTTWTLQPDFIEIGSVGGRFSLYNDTLAPYLSRIDASDQAASIDKLERWSVVVEEGELIDDPTYSATHLPALATESAVVPAGEPTVTPTETVTPTALASSSGNDNHLTGPLIAAAVVPTTVFVLIVTGFCIFIFMRRRRLRQIEENSPYPSSPRTSRPPGSSSVIMSELFDNFVEDPIDRWKRGNAKKPQGLTSMSLLSSNLSASLWSFRNPQESNVTMVANPLTAPPPARSRTSDSEPGTGDDVIQSPSSLSTKKWMENRVSFCVNEVPPSPLTPRRMEDPRT